MLINFKLYLMMKQNNTINERVPNAGAILLKVVSKDMRDN